MKININNVKKFASMGLVLLEVATLTGCKTTLNEVITYEEPKSSITHDIGKNKSKLNSDNSYVELPKTKVSIPIETIIEITDMKNEAPIVTEPAMQFEHTIEASVTEPVEHTPEISKSLLEKYDENPIVSDDLNQDIHNYYLEHIMEINDVLNPEYHDIHVKYGSLIYQRLVNAGIPRETIIGELANVILEQQLPRCVSEEEWKQNFGNIVSVLGEYESMYESYFCLSYLVHDEICELEHSHNEFGAVTCDELQTGFQKKYNMQY